MAIMPSLLALAQELAPKGRSMVSSLMMGFALGTGGMISPLVGKFADIFSIRVVLSFIALIPLLGIGLVYLLPAKILKKRSVVL